MNKVKKTEGFTIIEVVLVLAIAGLIFLIVFLAVPALQRNQRDTQRRNDVGRVVSQAQQHQTNNKGNLPTNMATFESQYLDADTGGFQDPRGGDYQLNTGAAGQVPDPGEILFVAGAVCNGEVSTNAGAGARNYAVLVDMEAGGAFCQSN